MQGVRNATGVMVLSTALLIGSAGGAVAAADTGTSDSTSNASPARDSNSEKPASNSSSEPANPGDSVLRSVTAASESLRNALTTIGSRFELGSVLSQETDSAQSGAVEVESDKATAADEIAASVAAIDDAAAYSEQPGVPTFTDVLSTATESEVPGSAAHVPVVAAPVVSGSGSDSLGAGTGAASSSTVTSTASDSVGRSVDVAGSLSVPTGHDTLPGELEPTQEAPPAPFAAAVTTMTFTTVATVAASLGNAAVAIPSVIWALPYSATPISDVIALLETLIASVTESVTVVARLPGDLFALLGAGAVGATPAVIGDSTDHRMDLAIGTSTPAVGQQTSSPLLVIVNQRPGEGVPIPSGFAAFGPTALAAAFAAPIKTAPASLPVRSGEYPSLFDRTFGAMLVPLSLWALATGAFPGLVGLLVVFGAGARVGYRQAKASFAVRVGGIARFAGPGPLGVVRSGSLVAIHQRDVRAVGQRNPYRFRLGDQVA